MRVGRHTIRTDPGAAAHGSRSRFGRRRWGAACTALLLLGGAAVLASPSASATEPAASDVTVEVHENLAQAVTWAGADANLPFTNPVLDTAPQHGTLSCTTGWDCSYSPDRDYAGPDSFTWRVQYWDLSVSEAATATVVVHSSPVAPVPSSDAGVAQLAAAMVADPSTLAGASVVLAPPSPVKSMGVGQLHEAFPSVGLPSDGSTFGVLGTGDVSLADLAQNYPIAPLDPGSGKLDFDLNGSGRGGSDDDTTVIRVDLTAPATANCLRLDFAFLSEEYPDYVGSAYNDAFVAELDHDTWTTTSSSIGAPDNFAFDPSGDVVSINSTGQLAMSGPAALHTAYNGTTPLLQASTPVEPGTHSLYLSIFDQGDHKYDSAAFVDNIRFVHVADPAAGCAAGAVLPDAAPTVSAGAAATGAEGSPVALTGSASDPESEPLTTSWSYTAGAGVDAGATCSFSTAASTSTDLTCTDDGTYTATLTASDGVNEPVLASTTVTISNSPPSVAITSPADGTGILPGSGVTLTASVADAGANDVVTCAVDWGDGTTSSVQPSAGACETTHSYSTSGTPVITVTATDDDGGSSIASVLVVVSSPTDKVTGGGWIADGAGRSSFGFVAKATKSGFDGQLQVTTAAHRVHCDTVAGLAVLTDHATWSGQCTLDGVSGYRYAAAASQGLEHAAPDHWTFTLKDAAGQTLLAQSADLGGGNITVR